MSKHTPTPWIYRHNPDSLGMGYAIGIFGDKSHLSSTWVADCGHINNEAATANAKRIVECVNALEGVEDPFQFVKEAKELRVEMPGRHEERQTIEPSFYDYEAAMFIVAIFLRLVVVVALLYFLYKSLEGLF